MAAWAPLLNHVLQAFQSVSRFPHNRTLIISPFWPQVIPTAELLTSARKAVAAWAPLANHPALAGLRGTFVSDDIDGTKSLFFVHDYHPGTICLQLLLR